MKKELLFKIINGLKGNERSLEDNSIEIDGVKYGITNFKEDGWDDEGKYQYNTEKGQLCSYDDKWNIIEVFDFFLEQNVSRSGSYFSDYYYDYDDINPYTLEKVIVPEQIIPAHYKDKIVYISK